MSASHDHSILRTTIDINFANKKKSTSFKWSLINSALFVLFASDLWYKCPLHTTWLHYVEAALASVLCASAAFHAARYSLLALRSAPRLPTSPHSPVATSSPRSAVGPESLSLSRSWASSSGEESPSRSPGRVRDRDRRPAPQGDQFIADRDTLADYLGRAETRAATVAAAAAVAAAGAGPARPGTVQYQLSAAGAGPLAAGAGAGEERDAGAGGEWEREGGLWRRVHAEPARLSEHTRALRLWLHATVLARLVTHARYADEALQRHRAALGEVGLERLRQLSALEPAALALLPYLEPFPNQRYVVRRVRDLAQGGCLSAYRWNAGGDYDDAAWDDSLPTDSELVMHLFTTYMDSQLRVGEVGGVCVCGGGGVFTARHTSRAPARPPRRPGALVLHRTPASPPHYLLVRDMELIELPPGRNNLLHSLLLFLSAAAARGGELGRVQLGPAGLNLLWVLGR